MQSGFKATKHVTRDVNPIWKSMVMLQEVEDTDMIQFLVKDVGVFQDAHLGCIGPKLLASGAMKVGNFQGFLPLEPAKEIPGQGWPILEISMRHSEAPSPLSELPSVGNTSLRREIFDIPTPSAPAGFEPEPAPQPEAAPQTRGSAAASGCAAGSAAYAACAAASAAYAAACAAASAHART